LLNLIFVLACSDAGRAVLDELIHEGVRLQSGQFVKLPPPIMPDGLDGSRQTAILRQAAGKYPLDRFLRNSIVSPFTLEIKSIHDATGSRGGQRVDFYFVAYGGREALMDEKLFDELVRVQEGQSRSPRPMTTRALTADELTSRGLSPREAGQLAESYVVIDLPILERVQLSGIGRAMRQQTEQSLLGAWKLDDQFADDPQFANRWRPILRDQVGRMSLGPPHPYSGLGGFIKITRLHEPPGAVLVECHAAFDEPYAWFEGKNLLRSKLPLVVQDNVRKFRAKLARASGN
jgi:hypothetical protein